MTNAKAIIDWEDFEALREAANNFAMLSIGMEVELYDHHDDDNFMRLSAALERTET